MLLDALLLQRPERVEADVQRDALDLRAARARPGVKCRPAVGAAAEPALARVDRLVALGVRERLGDVRRQRRRSPARLAVEPNPPAPLAEMLERARPPVAVARRAAAASAARAPPTRRPRRRSRSSTSPRGCSIGMRRGHDPRVVDDGERRRSELAAARGRRGGRPRRSRGRTRAAATRRARPTGCWAISSGGRS